MERKSKENATHPFWWFFLCSLLLWGVYGITIHLEQLDRAVLGRHAKDYQPKKKVEQKPEVKPKKEEEKAPKEPTRVVFGEEEEPEDYGTNDRNSLNGLIVEATGHIRGI